MELFILCLKIFSARIIDVSMSTIKTVYIVKEKKTIATIISFFEVIIWFEVARSALNTEINSFLIPISYAGGYSVGTFIGTYISTNFIKGFYNINVISNIIKNKEINELKKNGFGISSIKIESGAKLLIAEIKKQDLKKFKNIISKYDKNAFIFINDTKIIHNGYFN